MAEHNFTGWVAAAVAFTVADFRPRPLFEPARVAWRTQDAELSALALQPEFEPEEACMIVLARLEDFTVNGSNEPQRWKPAHRGHFGTAAATRTLGWGTVLSIDEGKRAPTSSRQDMTGLNLSGSVGDQSETLTVHCDVTLLDPDDVPETSDLFEFQGKRYCITAVDRGMQKDGGAEMTVSGIRWKGCITVSTPAGFTAPAQWA